MSLVARMLGRPGSPDLTTLIGSDRDAMLHAIETGLERGDPPDSRHLAWLLMTYTQVQGDSQAREAWLRAKLDRTLAEVRDLRNQIGRRDMEALLPGGA